MVLIQATQLQSADKHSDPVGVYDEDFEIQDLLRRHIHPVGVRSQRVAVPTPQPDMGQLAAFLKSIDMNGGHQQKQFAGKKTAFIPYCKKQ